MLSLKHFTNFGLLLCLFALLFSAHFVLTLILYEMINKAKTGNKDFTQTGDWTLVTQF